LRADQKQERKGQERDRCSTSLYRVFFWKTKEKPQFVARRIDPAFVLQERKRKKKKYSVATGLHSFVTLAHCGELGGRGAGKEESVPRPHDSARQNWDWLTQGKEGKVPVPDSMAGLDAHEFLQCNRDLKSWREKRRKREKANLGQVRGDP